METSQVSLVSRLDAWPAVSPFKIQMWHMPSTAEMKHATHNPFLILMLSWISTCPIMSAKHWVIVSSGAKGWHWGAVPALDLKQSSLLNFIWVLFLPSEYPSSFNSIYPELLINPTNPTEQKQHVGQWKKEGGVSLTCSKLFGKKRTNDGADRSKQVRSVSATQRHFD